MSLASYIYNSSYCCVTICKDIGKYISSDRYCTIMWFIHVFAWMIISMHWWYSSYWLFPNTINNLQFAFERTFREHEGARAGHKLEKRIKKLYEKVLQCTYRCFLSVCGILLAALWGVINGCVAFIQTWYISPCTRIFMVLFKGLLPLITEPIRICSTACCGARGAAGITEKLNAFKST